MVVTDTETEAFLLENTLIKKHQPKYNIDLKDAKRYAWIELTKEDTEAGIARRATGNGTFFGPFVSAAERDHVLAVAKKVFHLRTCKKLRNAPALGGACNPAAPPVPGTVSPAEYKNSEKGRVAP